MTTKVKTTFSSSTFESSETTQKNWRWTCHRRTTNLFYEYWYDCNCHCISCIGVSVAKLRSCWWCGSVRLFLLPQYSLKDVSNIVKDIVFLCVCLSCRTIEQQHKLMLLETIRLIASCTHNQKSQFVLTTTFCYWSC